MSTVLLNQLVPIPNTESLLYTVGEENALVLANLLVTSLDGEGITLGVYVSKSNTPTTKDYVAYSALPLVDENGNTANNFILPNIVLAQGESMFVSTQNNNIVFRLTGYPTPYTSQSLNVN